MRKYVGNIIIGIIVILVFAPWAVGIVDGFCVFLTGQQLTSIPWVDTSKPSWTIPLAIFWPFICLLSAAVWPV